MPRQSEQIDRRPDSRPSAPGEQGDQRFLQKHKPQGSPHPVSCNMVTAGRSWWPAAGFVICGPHAAYAGLRRSHSHAQPARSRSRRCRYRSKSRPSGQAGDADGTGCAGTYSSISIFWRRKRWDRTADCVVFAGMNILPSSLQVRCALWQRIQPLPALRFVRECNGKETDREVCEVRIKLHQRPDERGVASCRGAQIFRIFLVIVVRLRHELIV
jgi:hypothetical protein